jgi:glutathione synthase/RimK-type ligase-like ATP-grasp enzyme
MNPYGCSLVYGHPQAPTGARAVAELIEALAERGVEASPAVWDNGGVDWAGFDLVVVRSTWDYADRRWDFLAWAESLPHVLNSADVLRWNTDKRYLKELAVDVIPTTLVEPGAPFQIPEGPFVVKPSVGAGSIGAARYAPGDERARAHAEALHTQGKTVMVQPYLEAVDRDGEVALMYVDGAFSHAVRKGPLLTAGAGPGSGLYLEEDISATEPSREELELGDEALSALPFDRTSLLYARVDLLPGPVVLEVELTEPSLFIGYADGVPERFADAIAAASQRRRISAENGPTTSQ